VPSFRRRALLTLFAVALASCGGGSGSPTLALGASPPDIVLVVTDDAHLEHLRFFRATRDAVLNRGLAAVRFRRYYASTPLCSPSRAGILTGRTSRHTGIRFNMEVPPGTPNGGATAFRQLGLESSTIATWLRAAGYRTCLVGKYLNNYDKVVPAGSVPEGWDFWRGRMRSHFFDYSVSIDGVPTDFGSAEADYSTDVFRGFALDAIRSTPAGTPLFLYLAFDAPHLPAPPAPRHAALFPGLAAPDTPNHPERNRNDKPAWLANRVFTAVEEANADRGHADGARCMVAVDEAVAAIVAEMEAAGRLDRALFLVVNDNGWCAGSHGWPEKRVAYEESARVFAFAASKDPTLIARTHGVDAVVGNVDVAPTLAEIAGAVVPNPIDGVSFASLLRDPGAPDVRPDLLLECGTEDVMIELPSYCGLVNATRKYVEYANGERELYDLAGDPWELRNLANLPERAAEVAALSARLAELKAQ